MTNTRTPLEIAHFVIRTHDMARAIAFYKAFLGARVAAQNDMIAFLTYDHEHHRLAIIYDRDAAPRQQQSFVGVDHIAFTARDVTSLLLAYRERADSGIRPALCIDHGMTVSMYYADPDGNRFEVQAQVFDDPADSARFMKTKAFADDPRGPEFDPEPLLKRLDGGEDENQLLSGMKGRMALASA